MQEQSLTKILQNAAKDINAHNRQLEVPSEPVVAPQENIPQAGLLGAQAFNGMAQRVIDALKEIVELQVTEIQNRRSKAKADMEDLTNSVDTAFAELEKAVSEHRERIMIIAGGVKDKIGALSEEMKKTSSRLDKFAGTITDAHDELFVKDQH